ncbi:transporter substrate-binding protein [Herbaspirillum chlorophenolicum]|uniref:Transporter substrate-binding protein n=1 Tax=Herbaspirillum chlorophenolicum TaxID=211589 RepID=A0ABW8EX86_9BURK|nr:transporter substrate-binding protein [Herbaspirillum chlorophenolicum]
MSFTRRNALKTLAGAAALAAAPLTSLAKSDDIVIGSLHDLSGGLDILGKPMQDAMLLAVQEINDAGGLLGKKVSIATMDPQSNMQLYAQYAQQMALKDKVTALFGGITSASREVIRPVMKRFNTLYFYNTQYEGGVCDRNTFCTGQTPAQNVDKLIPYVTKRWGKKIYVVAADYNYGQITNDWIKKYAAQSGATVLASDFFPLDVNQFGPTIQKIQAAQPDMVISVLVGGAHMAFYRQWAAAGMNKKIPMASTTFNNGNEHIVLSPAEADGIVTAFSYFESIDTPVNKAFVERWHKKFGASYPYIGELAAATYQGVHLWALGVKKAGSVDRLKTIQALETGISFDGPSGKVTIDPATHHCTLDIQIAECQNKKWKILESFKQQKPVDTAAVCDLIKSPNENKQFVIKV